MEINLTACSPNLKHSNRTRCAIRPRRMYMIWMNSTLKSALTMLDSSAKLSFRICHSYLLCVSCNHTMKKKLETWCPKCLWRNWPSTIIRISSNHAKIPIFRSKNSRLSANHSLRKNLFLNNSLTIIWTEPTVVVSMLKSAKEPS